MKLKSIIALSFSILVSASVFAGNGGLDSLRSDSLAHEAPATPLKKTLESDTPLPRDFVQQPPLIPHDTRGIEVNKDVNGCLRCHSWKNASKYGATKISVTHFHDRNNKQLADVAPGRYFCLQCHVPQANTKPLKENNFEPVESLK